MENFPMFENLEGLIATGIVVLIFLAWVMDGLFGPSDVTKVAQRRLYEQDKAEAEGRFEQAVQAEMARIRKN